MEIKRHLPNFEDGIIIRAERMKQLVDQSFLLPNLIYYNYTDGIISGCEVYESDGKIILTEGVIRLNGKLFLLDKDIMIPYYATDKLTYLKISCIRENINSDGNEYIFSVDLSEEKPTLNQLEICRFKLQKGARLRYIYDDFSDMDTEFDTINIIHTKYSSHGYSTISLKLLKNFAREMISLKPTDQLDIFFCLQILGLNNVLNIDGIIYYIENKLNYTIEDINNYEVYKGLLEIIKMEKTKTKVDKTVKKNKRKILVY